MAQSKNPNEDITFEHWWPAAKVQLSAEKHSAWQGLTQRVPFWDSRVQNQVFYPRSTVRPIKQNPPQQTRAKQTQAKQTRVGAWGQAKLNFDYPLEDFNNVSLLKHLKEYRLSENFAKQTLCAPSLELAWILEFQVKNNFSVLLITLSPYPFVNVAKILALRKLLQEQYQKELPILGVINKRFFTYYATHMNELRINAGHLSSLFAGLDYLELTNPEMDTDLSKVSSIMSQYLVVLHESHIQTDYLDGNAFIEGQASAFESSALSLVKQIKSLDSFNRFVNEDQNYYEGLIDTKNIILSGVNDFIDLSDHNLLVDLKFKNFAYKWELLRSESIKHKVSSLSWDAYFIGKEAELAARLQFVIQFFRVVGIELKFQEQSVDWWQNINLGNERIDGARTIICASDTLYATTTWKHWRPVKENAVLIVAGDLSKMELPKPIKSIHRKISPIQFWPSFMEESNDLVLKSVFKKWKEFQS